MGQDDRTDDEEDHARKDMREAGRHGVDVAAGSVRRVVIQEAGDHQTCTADDHHQTKAQLQIQLALGQEAPVKHMAQGRDGQAGGQQRRAGRGFTGLQHRREVVQMDAEDQQQAAGQQNCHADQNRHIQAADHLCDGSASADESRCQEQIGQQRAAGACLLELCDPGVQLIHGGHRLHLGQLIVAVLQSLVVFTLGALHFGDELGVLRRSCQVGFGFLQLGDALLKAGFQCFQLSQGTGEGGRLGVQSAKLAIAVAGKVQRQAASEQHRHQDQADPGLTFDFLQEGWLLFTHLWLRLLMPQSEWRSGTPAAGCILRPVPAKPV